MNNVRAPKELTDKILQALEIARNTGRIKKGTNEVTKTIERGMAKLVVLAEDVQPKEIVMHIPTLCNEKKCHCVFIASKEELGRAIGINVPTAAACIVELGEAKDLVNEINDKIRQLEREK